MPQLHLDRLTAVDASFLDREREGAHMHVGALLVFDGPAPAFTAVQEAIRERLHLVPRYRQRLEVPRLQSGRPLWVDAGGFDLDDHLLHAAVPAPGGPEALARLTARIFGRALDRSRPLWEMWIVEGLQDGRFALVSKTHHALIDGVGGMDLAATLLDLTPEGAPVEHDGRPWSARPRPSGAEVLAAGVLDGVGALVSTATRAAAAATRPSTLAADLRAGAEGIGEVAWAGLNPAPATPLNVPIGPDRRYAVVRETLADVKLVKDTFGGTVNDVVLAVVTGALRAWLHSRAVATDDLQLRALVPVSTRGADDHGHMGNRITAVRGPVPVHVADPVTRLGTVRAAMDGIKESKQALGAELISSAQSFAPPTLLAQASRLNFSTRLFNLIVTNVPGPQFPLYLLGRRLQDLQPVAFLPEDHALAVAIMSYDGALSFGLLADHGALSADDVDVLTGALAASTAELVAAAKRAAAPDR